MDREATAALLDMTITPSSHYDGCSIIIYLPNHEVMMICDDVSDECFLRTLKEFWCRRTAKR
jgi:hypothetical protein